MTELALDITLFPAGWIYEKTQRVLGELRRVPVLFGDGIGYNGAGLFLSSLN